MALSSAESYAANLATFDDLIGQLQALRAANFGNDADKERDWGDAGSLRDINTRLQGAISFATGTAE